MWKESDNTEYKTKIKNSELEGESKEICRGGREWKKPIDFLRLLTQK